MIKSFWRRIRNIFKSQTPLNQSLSEFDRMVKNKSYKGKGQLISIGYYFKCSCGKIYYRKDMKPSKRELSWADSFGGIGAVTFFCEKCGKRWHINMEIENNQ